MKRFLQAATLSLVACSIVLPNAAMAQRGAGTAGSTGAATGAAPASAGVSSPANMTGATSTNSFTQTTGVAPGSGPTAVPLGASPSFNQLASQGGGQFIGNQAFFGAGGLPGITQLSNGQFVTSTGQFVTMGPNGQMLLQGGISNNPFANSGMVMSPTGQQLFQGPDGTVTSLIPIQAGFSSGFGGVGAPGGSMGMGLAGNNMQTPDQIANLRVAANPNLRRQILGPMSIIQRAPLLQPTVLASKNITVNGLLNPVSGVIVQEYPGAALMERTYARVIKKDPAKKVTKRKKARRANRCG